MENKRTIEKITFNAQVDGRWYNRVNIGITPNNGYTNHDINCKGGACFSASIGKEYYDLKIKQSKDKKRYFINATLLERNKNGRWVKSPNQKKVYINNIRVKFCDNEFV